MGWTATVIRNINDVAASTDATRATANYVDFDEGGSESEPEGTPVNSNRSLELNNTVEDVLCDVPISVHATSPTPVSGPAADIPTAQMNDNNAASAIIGQMGQDVERRAEQTDEEFYLEEYRGAWANVPRVQGRKISSSGR